MDVRKVLALRGPNIWASVPVLEAWVDFGPLPDLVPGTLPGFYEWLRGWVPDASEHPGDAVSRFPDGRHGTSLAHVLEYLALELQRRAGTEVSFGHTCATPAPGVWQVVCQYEFEELGRSAFTAAHELCLAVVQGRPADPASEVAKLRDLARRLRETPLSTAVIKAARRRDVPVRELGAGILLLGQGTRQRRVLGTRTDRTGALAEAISRDEDLTRNLLRAVGVPVVEPGSPVDPELTRWHLLVVHGRVVSVQGLDPNANTVTRIHPEVASRAVDAAEMVGLDVAGVVFAARDLGLPPGPGCGVVTVEADPPVEEGVANDVGEAIVEGLFGPGRDGRVPVVAVSGVNGKTTTTRLIAHILAQGLNCVGMTCTDGIYIDGQLIESGDCSGPRSAQTVLQHPEVEAAVLETARGGILRAGLGFDRCDVAVVINVGEGDHLGCGGVETVEQLARVKRVVVEAVHPGGTAVLNAADPLVAAMADWCHGSVTFFANSADHPVVVAHRAAGGRAVFVRDGRIVLARGRRERPVALLSRVPLTGGGRVGFQVENVLAAVATAWGLRVPHATIRAGLRSFDTGVGNAPARFNLLEVNGAVAILDYGHNPSSLAAILETLDRFPPAHRTAVYSAAGDRRDTDLIRQGEQLGDAFDRVILYEDGNCTRGRPPGKIIELFREGLAGRSRVGIVEEVMGAVRAVDLALSTARPGELLLIQVDVVDETLDLVQGYLARSAGREIGVEEALGILPGAVREPVRRRVKRTGLRRSV